jgi:hypothetical protein
VKFFERQVLAIVVLPSGSTIGSGIEYSRRIASFSLQPGILTPVRYSHV